MSSAFGSFTSEISGHTASVLMSLAKAEEHNSFNPSGSFADNSWTQDGKACHHPGTLPILNTEGLQLTTSLQFLLRDADLTIAQALLQKHSVQDLEPIFKSSFVPYGMLWCVLALNRCHLRMCICRTNKIVFAFCIYACLFSSLFPSRAKIQSRYSCKMWPS